MHQRGRARGPSRRGGRPGAAITYQAGWTLPHPAGLTNAPGPEGKEGGSAVEGSTSAPSCPEAAGWERGSGCLWTSGLVISYWPFMSYGLELDHRSFGEACSHDVLWRVRAGQSRASDRRAEMIRGRADIVLLRQWSARKTKPADRDLGFQPGREPVSRGVCAYFTPFACLRHLPLI